MFCRVEGKESLGVAKIVSTTSRSVCVEFFVSPSNEPISLTVNPREITRVNLSPETRVYCQNSVSDLWMTGRVLVPGENEVRVQFPNRDIVTVENENVNVRCNLPIEDPVPYLSNFINHTPLFSDSRRSFVKSVLDQRRACRGMSSLLSSVIELEDHQVRVVERVLKDPVQRYLLADEVGLGKTIEAGVIIRQFVLDDDDHFIVVAVPSHLLAQWRNELEIKFLLNYVLDTSLFIVSIDDNESLYKLLPQANMLVIDEAHQLVKDLNLSSPDDRYIHISESAKNVERLLLLSATPVFGNESGFLAMLHLLDPLNYSLSDLDSFKARIANRQALTHLLAELSPENIFFMEDAVDRLIHMFPEDDLLQSCGVNLKEVLNKSHVDEDIVLGAISEIRTHVSETYRLHRRILRNRRSSVSGLTPKRSGLEIIQYDSDGRNAVFSLLEQWRLKANLSVYQDEHGTLGKSLMGIYLLLLDAFLTSPQNLANIVTRRLGYRDADDPLSLSLFEGERETLVQIQSATKQLDGELSKMEKLRFFISHTIPSAKVIVFCSSTNSASTVATFLSEQFPSQVVTCLQGQDRALDKFLIDPTCTIFVCDQNGEEGLNLHEGRSDRIIVHYDLPLSPNRIEQRIGRLDRYGFPNDISCYALVCRNDVYESEWCKCLNDGFGVFDKSIATLQYLIESEMEGLCQNLFLNGPEEFEVFAKRLGGDSGLMVAELHRIELQDQLDAMQDESLESFDSLIDVDSEWRKIEAQVDSWVNKCLLFEKKSCHVDGSPPPDRVFRFQYNHDRARNTLVPLDRFIDNFLPVIDFDAPGGGSRQPLSFPFSYRRETATAKGVQLLRFGNPFIDNMMKFTCQDDRGKSFALWRYFPGYQSVEKVDHFFRFDFIVEVNIELALEMGRHRKFPHLGTLSQALGRQGDVLLPPLYYSIWLDSDFEVPNTRTVKKYLDFSYSKFPRPDGSFDRNINNHRWEKVWALGLPVTRGWSDVCQNARSAALSNFKLATNLDDELNRVLEGMAQTDKVYFSQRQSRLSLLSSDEREREQSDLETEFVLRESLRAGIAEPKITIDSVGVVFISDIALFR